MAEYTFAGPTGWRYEDEQFSAGETVDVPEGFAASFPQFFDGVEDEMADVSEANPATDDNASSPFAPDDYTVGELEAELEAGSHSDAELDALAAAERDGKDRETALEAIDDARSES